MEDKPITEEDRRAQAEADREQAELTAKHRAEEANQPCVPTCDPLLSR